MAKQVNIFKMQGTIGDATFYKTQDGHLVREKGGVSADRIKNDPSYQRTRENMSDFGYACEAARVLKNAFNVVTAQAPDNRTYTRLSKAVRLALKEDTSHVRGQRTLNSVNVKKLRNFEFNEDIRFESIFKANYQAVVNRTSGTGTITFNSFIPDINVVAPRGTTHFKFVAVLAAIDFENGLRTVAEAETDLFPIDGTLLSIDPLIATLGATPAPPLFLVLGISFCQNDHEVLYLSRDESHNPASIVQVEI